MNYLNNIIKTKLFIPNVNEKLLYREKIFDLLNNIESKKLIYISAPPGFGKTSTICEWIRRSKNEVSWFSIDEWDNNIKRFFTYLISAIQNTFETFGKDLLPIINNSNSFEIDFFCSMFINEINNLNKNILLVLEDYHLITNNDIHKIISYLLKNSPDNFKIIISSRHKLNNLSISKLRVKDKVLEISQKNFLFNKDDICDYFKSKNININSKQSEIILNKTEGWPLSLKLALMSIGESNDINKILNSLTSDNEFIMEFLIEEVLENLDEKVTNFLLKTSILTKINSEICNYLLQISNSFEIINELQEKNIFIYSIDNNNVWFKIHSFFNELLLKSLKSKFPNEISHLYLKAGEWLENSGNLIEAIDYTLKSENINLASKMINKYAFKMVSLGEIETLKEWMNKLGEENILKNPNLCIYYLWVLSLTGLLDEARSFIIKTEEIHQSTNLISFESQISNIKATIARREGKVEDIIKYSNIALEKLEKKEDFILATSYFNLGIAYLIKGDFDNSIKELTNSIPYNQKAGNIITSLAAKVCKSRILMLQGFLFESEKLYNQVISQAKELNLSKHSLIGTVLVDLANINYYFNKLDKCEELLLKGIELTKQAYNTDSSYGYNVLLNLSILMKNFDLAENSIIEIQKYANSKNISSLDNKINLYQTLLWQLQGKDDLVKKWFFSSQLNSESDFSSYHEIEAIILINYYRKARDYDKSIKIIENILPKFKKKSILTSLIRILVLKSLVYKNVNVEISEEALKEALKLSEKNSIIRIFIEYKDEVSPIIIKIISQLKLDKKFTESLFENLDLSNVIEDEKNSNLLSEREIELLSLIESGYKNQAISEKLFVSLNTVKTHIKNIYRKLEVNTRTQALSKAKSLGILKDEN